MELRGKKIVVGLSGGIAAFKGVELVRELGRRGAEVRVVLSEAATRFVGPVTFTGLVGRPPVVDLWDPSYAGEVHVELGNWADAMVVAPATMNLLGRVVAGLADDALTATLACMAGPVIYAPAMHPRMWNQASTRRNVARLREDGAILVGPVEGPLASGETGMGRMAEPVAIADAVQAALLGAGRPKRAMPSPDAAVPALERKDLDGLRVLISAGPTVEDLDPVRYLGNRSTGKMGYAIVERAVARGAVVTLVAGPVTLPDPVGCAEIVKVRSALEMHEAVTGRSEANDVIVMTAAVADYRPKHVALEKIKKGGEVVIELVRNPDILQDLGERREGPLPVLVGFALETTNVEAYARDKLVRKRVDLVVANEAKNGFGGEDNLAMLVSHEGTRDLPRMPKTELADRILDRALELYRRALP